MARENKALSGGGSGDQPCKPAGSPDGGQVAKK
jgi:hypothetical protein